MNQVEKDLVARFGRWLIYVLIGLNLVTWGVAYARCQEKEKDHASMHRDLEEWEDNVRYAIVDVTGRDERLVFFTRRTRTEVQLRSFGYDRTTRFERTGDVRGCSQVFYCLAHLHAYEVSKAPERYCRK